jgi:hypothetical protein
MYLRRLLKETTKKTHEKTIGEDYLRRLLRRLRPYKQPTIYSCGSKGRRYSGGQAVYRAVLLYMPNISEVPLYTPLYTEKKEEKSKSRDIVFLITIISCLFK